jgi:outer membrane exchange protein TraA
MLARRHTARLTTLVASLLFAASARAGTQVTVPTTVAPAIKGQGTGLCAASAISLPANVAADFGNLVQGTYIGAINTFMEAHKADRVESVVRNILDLSNNNDPGTMVKPSFGDFTDVMKPLCKTGGCDLFKNDTLTSFGTRLRGFLNVTPELTNIPIHIGLYADDAVSLAFFDKTGLSYAVSIRAPTLGLPTWRLTNTVTFVQTGIYPIEILYVEIAEHAALELSYFTGTFTDFEAPANQIPVTSLKDAGFTLFPADRFFQTVSGDPSFPDVNQCQQCDRQFVNHAGNNGCPAAYYCNEAALCAPCDTAIFCGPSCSPCGGATPFCINGNGKAVCGGCRDDNDCKQNFHCDTTIHECQECNVDADCPERGHQCVNHSCVWCASPDKCAGTSCNCCPKGPDGKQMQCADIGGGLADPSKSDHSPECVECVKNSDCGGAKPVCDINVGKCVAEIAQNESPDCCGPGCEKCCDPMKPDECVHLCLPGPFGTACEECRQDLDCEAGHFCKGGLCTECTHDRRCGDRCKSCGGDKPFCLDVQRASDAACVRCNTDDECVGGKCDKNTNKCTHGCAMSCAPDTPHCDGTACVECYADTQCPCGGTCDLSSHTCSTSCKNNGDCLGDEHCKYNDDGKSKSCEMGPLPDNVSCGSTLADICSGGNSIGSRTDEDLTPLGGLCALSVMSLLARRRARREEGRGAK